MRVLFASAEFAPLATVGGLASAAAGLVGALRAQGVTVDVVLPDYGGIELSDVEEVGLEVPWWAGPAHVRIGEHPVAGRVHLVDAPGLRRPHPYTQRDGSGWPDNDARFFAFSAAVADLARRDPPDVLHLNDWHTAAVPAALLDPPPTVLSIHNLAYQGTTTGFWLGRLGPRARAYEWYGGCNPFAGGLSLADAIVAVSPTYAEEILRPEGGYGLAGLLSWRNDRLVGIRNGIDTTVWDPATDEALVAPFDPSDLAGKAATRDALCHDLGLIADDGAPLIVIVSRLVEQKGIDLVLPLLRFLPTFPARLAVLGAGDAWLVDALGAAAAAEPERCAFVAGYDDALAHRLFAGGDLLLMPSRFEPCGLAQMQAMRYGTLPVATAVGGLCDTITDLDAAPRRGTGWLASSPDSLDVLDALHRAVRGWGHRARRRGAQRRGMSADWSWREPALRHIELYERLCAAARSN